MRYRFSAPPQNFRDTRRYGTPDGFSPAFSEQLYRSVGGAAGDTVSSSPTLTVPGEGAGLGLPPPVPVSPSFDPSRFGKCLFQPILVGTADLLALPESEPVRSFLFIVNTHASQTLFVAFGIGASSTQGVPLQANGGSIFFDSFVPQDDIHVAGSGASTTGVIFYSRYPLS